MIGKKSSDFFKIVDKSQYDSFVEEPFVKLKKSIASPIRHNKMPLFSAPIPSPIPQSQSIFQMVK